MRRLDRFDLVWFLLGASLGILAMAFAGYVPRWSAGHYVGFGLALLAGLLLLTRPKERVTEPLGWTADYPGMHWTCHVCGKRREDEDIGVASARTQDYECGYEMQTNVRYCRDSQFCRSRAPELAEEWLDLPRREMS